MDIHTFLSLDLKYGDIIYLANEKGEVLPGRFEDEYNNSSNTFRFSNFSNGKSEIIYINKLHDIRKS